MRDLPLVSIVTPAYNQADYLAETIDSILAQTYPNIEYIVLDDGSKDNTREVLKRYDGKIRWESHDNMGQSKTLNRGWSMAKGEIIGYLSSDDRLAPDAITKLVLALQKQTNAVVVYCDFNLIDATGKHLRSVITEDFDIHRLTVDLVCQPGPGALFMRQAYNQVQGWNERYQQVPDFDFWLRLSAHGPFVRVPYCLADYRIHDSSASFRSMSTERADEIVSLMRSFWVTQDSDNSKSATGTALMISAKHHAQSGRPITALERIYQAIKIKPSIMMEVSLWRHVLAGFFRKAFYRLTSTKISKT